MDIAHKPIRVLIVEGSAAVLHSLCRFLKNQSNIDVVGTATDGRQALASACALHPDLVLLDFHMPMVNAVEAATQLRQDLPTTRIIMAAVHDGPDVRQACREFGADGFVAKQHMAEELPALIEQIFSHDRDRRSHDDRPQ